MKFFHTADWHLGKLVQGVYMTEDQRFVLRQFIDEVKIERPDAVIIAGDVFDRGMPPVEAVSLLDEVLDEIVLQLKIPVLAIAGNHDSPGRLQFGSKLLEANGYHIRGRLDKEMAPVILHDEFGEVHFHLIPFADPSAVRHVFEEEEISNHHEAMKVILDHIQYDDNARHVIVSHSFVTPHGEPEDNTSDSERPIAIGGAEYVSAALFDRFHYTALGHLHQAHYTGNEKIRYSGSPLKYSISEENHQKGYTIVELDAEGYVSIEKRLLTPKRDIRTVKGTMQEILQHPVNEDYVFVKLLDDAPVLSPMEQVRSVYPNAMHVERSLQRASATDDDYAPREVGAQDDRQLFASFYEMVKGQEAEEETKALFDQLLLDVLQEEDGR